MILVLCAQSAAGVVYKNTPYLSQWKQDHKEQDLERRRKLNMQSTFASHEGHMPIFLRDACKSWMKMLSTVVSL